MFVIKEPSNYDFEKVGIKGKIFLTGGLTQKSRFVLVDTEDGHKTTIRQRECDFVYYILEGSGYFEIEGKIEECRAGDLAVIPAGNKFTYKGKMKLLLISTPPWFAEQEETL